MTKILVNVDRAGDAIKWAAVHFGNTFNVQHDFPSTRYRFEFDNSVHATMFALKWV